MIGPSGTVRCHRGSMRGPVRHRRCHSLPRNASNLTASFAHCRSHNQGWV